MTAKPFTPSKMYRYQPPKSSIWGHRLRKMPAQQARALLDQFLTTAVHQQEFKTVFLTVVQNQPVGSRLSEILSIPAEQFLHQRLTADQLETCIDEIIRLESTSSEDACSILLNHYLDITQWNIDGAIVETHSSLAMHYGALPCLTTRLWFETVEQFDYVKHVLADLGLCKLNDQHLKLMKYPYFQVRRAQTAASP